VAWLSDGSGLVLDAIEASSFSSQLWQVSYPGGAVRRITNDLNSYEGVTLTGDSTALVTVQGDQLTNLWVAPGGDAKRARQITSSRSDGVGGVAWTPDGRIVYASRASGNPDIWIAEADGSDAKPLTTENSIDVQPSVSADGRHIVFVSFRTGNPNIWRMDIDGGHPMQLTQGGSDVQAEISPDGKWVIYRSFRAETPTLWRVSIEGGDSVQLTQRASFTPSISSDGKWVAYSFWDEPGPKLWTAVIPFEGGEPIQILDIPPSGRAGVQWASAGDALIFPRTQGGVSNLWSQPLAGGPPKQLTGFTTDRIFSFAWSRDGKQLVVARGTTSSDVVLLSNFK